MGVLQVALVTLGRHIGLLNNWYCLPEENEVSDRFYKWIFGFHTMSFQIPTDSVLFPLSTYITGKDLILENLTRK